MITDFEIINAAALSTNMQEAARRVGLHPTSFIARAKKLGCYVPNPGRKGQKRPARPNLSIPLDEILTGKHPQYGTNHLKRRLWEAKILPQQCNLCPTTCANATLVLDHINGDSSDHQLANLRILCPNCHSKTDTFAGRNKKTTRTLTNDLEIVDDILNGKLTRQILIDRKMTPNGANTKRVDRLRLIVQHITGV